MDEHAVVEWLKERRANCLRIAASKTRQDRAGWEDDARYFEAAIMMISRAFRVRDVGITAQDIHETAPERLN
jgi:hypothetical protein